MSALSETARCSNKPIVAAPFAGATGSSVAVRCDGLNYAFGGRRNSAQALSDVSFIVETGSVVGLLGPNGAGKTTLIELISGLRATQSGTIELFEQRLPPGHPRARHRLGFLPQRSVLYEDVSVDDNLRFAADLHRCPKGRVKEVLELVGLADRRQSIVSTLSGGMQRRVAIARALIHEPELLVLDEPTLGVDSDNRHRIWQYVRNVRRAGVTVLLSSNYLDEVEALCDGVIVLGSGRVVARMEPGELFRRAGWWLEAECEEARFPELERVCRQQGAADVVIERPTVRMRFVDAAGAHRSMNDLVATGLVSSIRERRPDLVEVFAAIRDEG
ncbi:MAG TPA: ABC transporter ATP-binding protein [Acidimicrobiales bacterium]|nr:ABC transporter ATP-binding protein [Acidimicrobiales bacterium]